MHAEITLGTLALSLLFSESAAVLPLRASDHELPSPQCSATLFFATLFIRNPVQLDSPYRSLRRCGRMPFSACGASARVRLDSDGRPDS